MPTRQDRRAYRRSPIQVPLEISDLTGVVRGQSVDVSRGGLYAAISKPQPVGTLLRVRVLAPKSDGVLAVGVVVRSFEGKDRPRNRDVGVAIALTSTSEAWDRFWDEAGAPGFATGEA